MLQNRILFLLLEVPTKNRVAVSVDLVQTKGGTNSHSEEVSLSNRQRNKVLKDIARKLNSVSQKEGIEKLLCFGMRFFPLIIEQGHKANEKKIAKINFFGRNVFRDSHALGRLTSYGCIGIAEERSLLLQVAKVQINLAKIKIWKARRVFSSPYTFLD
jgi:hypothetical protein